MPARDSLPGSLPSEAAARPRRTESCATAAVPLEAIPRSYVGSGRKQRDAGKTWLYALAAAVHRRQRDGAAHASAVTSRILDCADQGDAAHANGRESAAAPADRQRERGTAPRRSGDGPGRAGQRLSRAQLCAEAQGHLALLVAQESNSSAPATVNAHAREPAQAGRRAIAGASVAAGPWTAARRRTGPAADRYACDAWLPVRFGQERPLIGLLGSRPLR
jgi:hypothetical protein